MKYSRVGLYDKRTAAPASLLLCLFAVLSLLIAGCPGMGGGPRDQGDQLKLQEFKRGKLKGPQYFNEYYKFQLTTPRGWTAIRPRTGELVKFSPKSGNAGLIVSVTELKKEKPLDKALEEILDEQKKKMEAAPETGTFLKHNSLKLNVVPKDGESTKKITLLAFSEGKWVYQIYTQCEAATCANYEKGFREIIDSMRLTDKFIEGLGSEDFFTYLVKPDDTLQRIALRFLNDEKQGSNIVYFNQISTLVPNRPIDIPRYVDYVVRKGDTEQGLAKKFYNDPNRFSLIEQYNPTISKERLLTPGTKLKVPLYFNYTVKPGDTLPKLAARYLKSEKWAELLYIYNGKTRMRVGSTMKIPLLLHLRDYVLYTVKPNDSLATIAQQFTGDAANYNEIAEFNNILPPYELSIGQNIKIPKDIIKKRKHRTHPRKTKKTEEEKIEEEIEGPIYEPD